MQQDTVMFILAPPPLAAPSSTSSDRPALMSGEKNAMTSPGTLLFYAPLGKAASDV